MPASHYWMLSVAKCKKILHDNGLAVNESNVSEIRDILYRLAELDLHLMKMKTDAESNNIYEGFD